MAISEISTAQLVLIAMIVAVTGLTLANARRRLRRRGPSPSEYAREQIARLKEQQEVKGDLEQLLVELHEAARRLNAQMDTKAAKLEALIQDADQRITRLQAGAAQGSPAASGPPSGDKSGPRNLDVVVDDSTGSEQDRERVDPLRRRIITLAEGGQDPVQIARDTGTQPGEVELILALHAAGRTAPTRPEKA